MTLGFGEIVPVVILNADTYTQGTNGIIGLSQPNLYGILGINNFGFQSPFLYYFTVLAIITVAFILLYRLQDSRLGRAWSAIREDELAASSMGINTVTTKLMAFAIGEWRQCRRVCGSLDRRVQAQFTETYTFSTTTDGGVHCGSMASC